MSENDDLQAERDRLSNEIMRLRIERETSFPAGLLANAQTEEEARQIAQDALAWRGESPPAPAPAPTGAASYGRPGQISRNTLQCMSAEQIQQAAREGRLVDLGVGVPNRDQGTTRNGRHV